MELQEGAEGREEAAKEQMVAQTDTIGTLKEDLRKAQVQLEIEDRAPLLKQQREDYERAVAAVEGLTENLESTREEVELQRGEAEEAWCRPVVVERDRDWQSQQVSDLGRQVTAQEQLALAESRLAGRGLGKQASVAEGQGESGQKIRLRDVEILMAQTKQELKSVNNQLVDAKKRAEEHKGMSEAAERRMVESSRTLQGFKDQLEAKLKKSEEEKGAAEMKAVECTADATALHEKVTVLESEAGDSGGELRERLRSTTSDLEEARGKLQSSEKVESCSKSEAERRSLEAREAQENYERKMLLHAKDVEALNKLKAEFMERKVDLNETENLKWIMDERLERQAGEHSAEVARLKAEASSLQDQVTAMQGENSALHSQVETASLNDQA